MGPSAAIVLLVPSSLSRLAETPFLFFFLFVGTRRLRTGPQRAEHVGEGRGRRVGRGSSSRVGSIRLYHVMLQDSQRRWRFRPNGSAKLGSGLRSHHNNKGRWRVGGCEVAGRAGQSQQQLLTPTAGSIRQQTMAVSVD